MIQHEGLKAYIRKIRNGRKQAYAAQLYQHVLGKRETPDYTEAGLSIMGAQAVRMQFHEFGVDWAAME